MRIALAVDHAGVPLHGAVHDALADDGHEIVDLGEHDDYPNVALTMGRAVASGEAERGDPRLRLAAPACRSRHASCRASARRSATTTTPPRSA